MKLLIDLTERGVIPDRLIRYGIKMLDWKRLAEEVRKESEAGENGVCRFIQDLCESPIAFEVENPRSSITSCPRPFSRGSWESA